MASHVVVIDTSFRKYTVKVTPGKYMSDVLDEACAKAKLDASNYGIKHNNKQVDLSRTFRQTGLSSGAKLELVLASRSPSVVSVALQLPESDAKDVPGGRLANKFPSNSTLWHILRAFERATNFNFTGRGVAQTDSGHSGAGRIVYEQPVLNIMGRELASFTDLQKTLAQLGLNAGSCLIRLTFRKSETPLQEAMTEIEQYFKSLERTEPSGAHAGPEETAESAPSAESNASPAAVAGEPVQDSAISMEIDSAVPDSSSSEAAGATLTPGTPSEASVSADIIVGPKQRPMAIFAAPTSQTPQAALHSFNESDYEPSIAHAKLHQARLQNNSHNQRLLSDAEVQALAEEKAAKQASIKEVSVKVRFPDQLTAVAEFTDLDTGLSLYDFVQAVIVPDVKAFVLSWMGAKGPSNVPKDGNVRLIKDLGFAKRMVVNFNYENEEDQKNARNATVLRPEFVNGAKELRVQEVAAAAEEEDEEAKANSSRLRQKAQGTSGGEKKKGGLPKWLKGLPGKK